MCHSWVFDVISDIWIYQKGEEGAQHSEWAIVLLFAGIRWLANVGNIQECGVHVGGFSSVGACLRPDFLKFVSDTTKGSSLRLSEPRHLNLDSPRSIYQQHYAGWLFQLSTDTVLTHSWILSSTVSRVVFGTKRADGYSDKNLIMIHRNICSILAA